MDNPDPSLNIYREIANRYEELEAFEPGIVDEHILDLYVERYLARKYRSDDYASLVDRCIGILIRGMAEAEGTPPDELREVFYEASGIKGMDEATLEELEAKRDALLEMQFGQPIKN